MIIFLTDGDTREVRVATSLCSSTRAELFALRAALEELASIDDRDASLPVVVCTDSRAALALLQSGRAAQRTPVAADIWNLLSSFAEGGQTTYMQWVPSHCGLPGNERADALAGEASALPQDSIPIDVNTVQKAIARAATYTWQQGWPDGWYKSVMKNKLPGPVGVDVRSAAVDVHQLRAGHWSGSAQYLHRIGRRPTPECRQYSDERCLAALCPLCREEADTPQRVLLRCPALAGCRLRPLGTINPDPTIARDDGVVAVLAAGFRAQLSRIGYAP